MENNIDINEGDIIPEELMDIGSVHNDDEPIPHNNDLNAVNIDQQIVGEGGKRQKKENKIANNRNKALHGEEHLTRKGVIKAAKAPRPNVCNDSCDFKCKTLFTEEQRKEICSSFWQVFVAVFIGFLKCHRIAALDLSGKK